MVYNLIVMETVISRNFDEYLINELRAANYFGCDGHEGELIGLYLSEINLNKGDTIDYETFGEESDRALAVAIEKWNAGERV